MTDEETKKIIGRIECRILEQELYVNQERKIRRLVKVAGVIIVIGGLVMLIMLSDIKVFLIAWALLMFAVWILAIVRRKLLKGSPAIVEKLKKDLNTLKWLQTKDPGQQKALIDEYKKRGGSIFN